MGVVVSYKIPILALLALHFGSLWLVLAWLGLPLALLLAFHGWALLDGRGFSQLFPLRCPQKVCQDPFQGFPKRPRRLLRLYFLMIFVGECVKFAFLSKRNANFLILGKPMLAPSWSQSDSRWPMLCQVCTKLAQVRPSWPKLAPS